MDIFWYAFTGLAVLGAVLIVGYAAWSILRFVGGLVGALAGSGSREDTRSENRRGRWLNEAEWREYQYGPHHQRERARYAVIIQANGGTCSERVCVMPSRRIEPGAPWDLAHDHERGGRMDYLGPAHPQCNALEARQRGVTWDVRDLTIEPPAGEIPVDLQAADEIPIEEYDKWASNYDDDEFR